MLRIKITKNRNVSRVLRSSSGEVKSLVNKTVHRGGDRRLLRNALEVAVGQYVAQFLTATAADHLNTDSLETQRNKIKPLDLEPILARYYDGDINAEGNLTYIAEKELLVTTLDKLIAVEAKKFTDEITQVLADTKSLCGRVERGWDTKGDVFVLYQSSDLWLDKEEEVEDVYLRVPDKSQCVRGCTCDKCRVRLRRFINLYCSSAWKPKH